MLKPVEKQGRKANGKQENKSITKQVKPFLKEIAIEKGLEIESMVDIVDFGEEHGQNHTILEELLSGDLIKEPKNGKCYFFTDNRATKVQMPETGHYVYESIDREGKKFRLNIWDMFKLLSDKKDHEIVTGIVKAYGFESDEEKRKEKHSEMYLENIRKLRNDEELWKIKYPNSYSRIKSLFELLIVFNIIGLSNLNGDDLLLNDEPIFFASNSYIKKLANTKNVVRGISMLTLLGFIDKVKEEDIPLKYKEVSKKTMKDRGLKSMINYYRVNELNDELWEMTEKKATVVRKKRISMNNIGLKSIREKLGEDAVNRVFGNDKAIILKSTQINLNKRKEKEEIEEVEKPSLPF